MCTHAGLKINDMSNVTFKFKPDLNGSFNCFTKNIVAFPRLQSLEKVLVAPYATSMDKSCFTTFSFHLDNIPRSLAAAKALVDNATSVMGMVTRT